MNRIDKLFQQKKDILNIYLTAGFPELENTVPIVLELEKAGVDMVEIGMPFSDPLADGPVIQHSSTVAIKNGITLRKIFEQLREIREKSQIPILLMGYLNQMMAFGEEAFLEEAAKAGADGLIIPDLPVEFYNKHYRRKTENLGLKMIFLVSPQTPEERIKKLDEACSGFLYVVSSASITGNRLNVQQAQKAYFQRIQNMPLKNPVLIGFGIHDRDTFETACRYAPGAIIGSAFIRALEKSGNLKEKIHSFIKTIRP
jgi:tryptophan synthase alpha chain